jgi:GNAT superfamily N-acetyltransferase
VKDKVLIETYETTAGPLTSEDVARLHELSVSVYWPHRPQDLAFLIGVGEGLLACDEIGRAVGSGMYFPMGDDFAMIAMMMTSPRLQTLGAGRWLLRRLLNACAGRDLRLNATRSAYRLYESAGFAPAGSVSQQQGIARPIRLPEPPQGSVLRDFRRTDRDALVALDRAAFGADRSRILDAALPLCEGTVLERGGQVVAAALCRRFGRGRVVGPVLAEDDEAAMALVAPLIARHAGGFLRVDTPVQDTVFAAMLAAGGLGVYDMVTPMTMGRPRPVVGPARTYALMSQALG